MKPGIELDALVAEKVMGWTEKRLDHNKYLFEACGLSSVPRYSTDIAAAWEVAQKIKDKDEDNNFVIHISQSKNHECTAEVRYVDNSDPDDPILAGPFYLLGETPSHAICLAALKAVGG